MSGLLKVSFGVHLDLFGRKRRTRRVAARRVANGSRKVADQKDNRVTEVLQLTQFIEHHGVADVNVGGRRIQTELAAQLFAGGLGAGKLLLEFAFDQKRIGAAGNGSHRLLNVGRHFVFLFFGMQRFFGHRCGSFQKILF